MPLTIAQALGTRDSIARTLYSQLFAWLVHKINKNINPTTHQHRSIAVLDMFGFEVSFLPTMLILRLLDSDSCSSRGFFCCGKSK